MHLCLRIFFASKKIISYELLLELVEKTKELYVLLALTLCHFAIASFDMWYQKVDKIFFALVINFKKVDWRPKHIIANFFEPLDTSRQTLVKNLTNLLEEKNYCLC
jgi:hypothetical protein